MSYKGYIDITVAIESWQELDLESIAHAMNVRGGYSRWNCWYVQGLSDIGEKTLQWNGETGFLEFVMQEFQKDLRLLQDEFGITNDQWHAQVAYDSFEDPSENGAKVEFEIRNGRICNWKESVVMMVEKSPWFSFDMDR